MDITAVSTDGDLHEPVDEEATQRVGPCEETLKDDKSDENVDLKTELLTK